MSSPLSPSANLAPSASVNGHGLPTTYSNVFRASGSAEELILDFGLDAHRHTPEDSEPTRMLQRLVLSWGHAKRLAAMLRNLVQRHKQRHGPIPLPDANRPPNSSPPEEQRPQMVSGIGTGLSTPQKGSFPLLSGLVGNPCLVSPLALYRSRTSRRQYRSRLRGCPARAGAARYPLLTAAISHCRCPFFLICPTVFRGSSRVCRGRP